MVKKIGISMDDDTVKSIRLIKEKVHLMLNERSGLSLVDGEKSNPSQVWSAGCALFDYLLGLPDESFSKIRLHTYFLTSDYYLPYVLGNGKKNLLRTWKRHARELPTKYRIYEPEGGIGHEVPGAGMISSDVVRYQKTIAAFYKHGIFDSLENERKCNVLEIGGGYGALVHYLATLSNNATYVIVDLPETLLFSASYISLLNPTKRIYVYDKRNFDEFVNGDISSFDFVFVPNYKLDSLKHLKFELAINQNSLGEMTVDQAKAYIEFVWKTCNGVFYSHNQDRLAQNSELENLTELLEKRFTLTEVSSRERYVASVKSKINKLVGILVKILGARSSYQAFYYYREYIGSPRR